MKITRNVVIVLSLAGVAAQAQRNAAPANPLAENPEAVAEGREIYNRSCTACHGADGGVGDRAPGLGTPGRRYLRVSDRDLFDAIVKGIPGTVMPASGLAENDAWKIAAYIRALRGTAIDMPANGNVVRGEQIFWGKADCGSCHMLGGRGGLTGPELSNIARVRKLSSIRDALTKEQHRVPGDGGRHDMGLTPLSSYQTVRVVTRDGVTVRGVVKNEDSFSLQMLGSDDTLHMFSRDELREIVYEPKGLMPTDYDKLLTPNEFADLMAFLSRQAVTAPAAARRPIE